MDLRQYRPKLLCPAAPIVAVPRLDTVVVEDVYGQTHTLARADLFSDGPTVVPEPGDWIVFIPQPVGEPRPEIVSAAEFAHWEPIEGATLT